MSRTDKHRHHHEDDHHDNHVELKLTNTLSRVASKVVPEGVSHNGQFYVYYVNTFPMPANPLETELFLNQNGQLISLAAVNSTGDSFLVSGSSVSGGGASSDYSLFTVLDDNGTGTGRIRLFNLINNVFNLLATTLVSSVTPASMKGGSFSNDSQFIAVTYNDSATHDLVNLLLMLRQKVVRYPS